MVGSEVVGESSVVIYSLSYVVKLLVYSVSSQKRLCGVIRQGVRKVMCSVCVSHLVSFALKAWFLEFWGLDVICQFSKKLLNYEKLPTKLF